MKVTSLLFALFLFCSCATSTKEDANQKATATTTSQESSALGTDEELSFLSIPDGFVIQVYADDVENARSLELSETGVLFVGTRTEGNVYALVDENKDGRADKQFRIAKGLNMPNGVALKNGDLYIAEVHRILKISDVEANLSDNMQFEVVYDDLPTDKHHGWKYIAFGPDEKLYVPIGAPCNICESKDKRYASITRINADGTDFEIVQEGIRNTVGFNWHPDNKKLWFTDNGGDNLGDNKPSDELNFASQDGLHFGFPYCHQGDMQDPKFGDKHDCSEFTKPALQLGPHVAALGLEFWNNKKFSEAYNNKAFWAEHGSWNRTTPIGYRVMMADVTSDGQASNYTALVDGFRDNEKNETYGRPVDLEWMDDGSLLISDDFANKIYRLIYVGTSN